MIFYCLNRSGGDSEHPEVDNDENDPVELEKSNVLLLGPTGSGTTSFFSFSSGYKLRNVFSIAV